MKMVLFSPHLFHGPIDNEPLMACFLASEASLNKFWYDKEAWDA